MGGLPFLAACRRPDRRPWRAPAFCRVAANALRWPLHPCLRTSPHATACRIHFCQNSPASSGTRYVGWLLQLVAVPVLTLPLLVVVHPFHCRGVRALSRVVVLGLLLGCMPHMTSSCVFCPAGSLWLRSMQS